MDILHNTSGLIVISITLFGIIAFILLFVKYNNLRIKYRGVEIGGDNAQGCGSNQNGVHEDCPNLSDMIKRIDNAVDIAVNRAIDRSIRSNDWFHENSKLVKSEMWEELFTHMENTVLQVNEKYIVHSVKEVVRKKTQMADVITHPDMSKYMAGFGNEAEKKCKDLIRHSMKTCRIMDKSENLGEWDGLCYATTENLWLTLSRLEDQRLPFAGITSFNREDIRDIQEKNRIIFDQTIKSYFAQAFTVIQAYKKKLKEIEEEYKKMREVSV